MSRLGWGVLFHGALAVAVGGALHAGWLTEQQVALFVLGAILWYPVDWLIHCYFGWNPRPPADQDRT